MAHRIDDDGSVWIQGGTARIPAPGEPGGGPVVIDDTPPALKEHRKREEDKDARAFRANHTAQLYGDHYTSFAEARKTMNLAEGRGLTERSLKAFDTDFLARAKAAPSDEARQRFVDDAMDLRRALETQFGMTESTFKDMERRSDLGLKADALSRQAQAYPEDYALHAAVLDKVADGAAPLVTRERIVQIRRFEAEKMARSAMMGFIEQGRFDEGRALLATATDDDGNPGTLPLTSEAVKEQGGMLEQRHADAAAREVRLDRVDTVIEGTAGPTDDAAEWQALVEEHYQVAGPQMAELEPAERIGAEDDYVRKLGHLPKPLTRSLRAGMLSGEPGQEAAAALRLKTLADHDPALITAIPEAERVRAAAIAEFAELGLKPERAVELGEMKLAEAGDTLDEQALDLRDHRFGGTALGGVSDDEVLLGSDDATTNEDEATDPGGGKGDVEEMEDQHDLVSRDLNPKDAEDDATLRHAVRGRAENSEEELNHEKSIEETAAQGAATAIAEEALTDKEVRDWYVKQAKYHARTFQQRVDRGELTLREGARIASKKRNEIMRDAREIGTALAKAITKQKKPKGPEFEELEFKKAQQRFGKPISELSIEQKMEVWKGIITSSGKTNPKVTKAVNAMGKAARGLWIATAAIAVYNVLQAENKVEAAAREAATVAGGAGGGIVGGMAAGAIGGVFGGPVGVAVGVIAGGIAGAMGAEWLFDEVSELFE